MKENNRNNTVLIVALVAAGCLVLLCVGMAIAVFLFGKIERASCRERV